MTNQDRELIEAWRAVANAKLSEYRRQSWRLALLVRTLMKVRILIPGRKVDDVSYRCEKCGGEVMRSVPRAW